MNDPYSIAPLRQEFNIGTRVFVSKRCGWRSDSTGVIAGGPEPVQTLQGEDYYYWIRFDVAQHDLDGDGPYESAQILSRCMKVET